MLKKMMALAATTAMLGANAAAHAINGALAAVRNVTESLAAGDEEKGRAASGTNVQPSIPPLPAESAPKAAPRKAGPQKVAAHKSDNARNQRGKPARKKVRKNSR